MLGKLAALGGVVAFARSEKGQQLIAKAKAYANDPATKQKLAGLRDRYMNPR